MKIKNMILIIMFVALISIFVILAVACGCEDFGNDYDSCTDDNDNYFCTWTSSCSWEEASTGTCTPVGASCQLSPEYNCNWDTESGCLAVVVIDPSLPGGYCNGCSWDPDHYCDGPSCCSGLGESACTTTCGSCAESS